MNWLTGEGPRTPEDQSFSAVKQLTRMLEWESEVLSSDDVCAKYREWLYVVRDMRMERSFELQIPGVDSVARYLQAMDRKCADRMTLAPESSHRFLREDCDAALIEFLGSACEAELAVAGYSQATRPLWTALGDRYLPAGSGYESSVRSEAGFDPCEPYFAPRLGSIVVDFLSPYARGIRGPNGFIESVPSAEDACEAQKKLVLAAALLAEVGLGIRTFVDREIVTLVLRSDRINGALGSSSTPEYIGRAVLWNTHLSAAGIPDVAEQLVHEAIHCHAYRLELQTPFFASPVTSCASQELVSPWSGRSLAVSGYLHASFVWYGLANFWFSAFKRRVLPDEEALPHLVQAVRGFMADPLDLLGDARPAVAEPLLSALYTMQASIRQRWSYLKSVKLGLVSDQ